MWWVRVQSSSNLLALRLPLFFRGIRDVTRPDAAFAQISEPTRGLLQTFLSTGYLM